MAKVRPNLPAERTSGHSGCWIWLAAAARSCWGPISACSTTVWCGISNISPDRFKKAVYKDVRSGQWRLTIEEKKRILTSHIFGVDIDHQAVEVTKLSLLLKVLEGENAETVGRQLQLFQERALPNLADNIKCGNSLIGPKYFTGRIDPRSGRNEASQPV